MRKVFYLYNFRLDNILRKFFFLSYFLLGLLHNSKNILELNSILIQVILNILQVVCYKFSQIFYKPSLWMLNLPNHLNEYYDFHVVSDQSCRQLNKIDSLKVKNKKFAKIILSINLFNRRKLCLSISSSLNKMARENMRPKMAIKMTRLHVLVTYLNMKSLVFIAVV